MIGIEFDLKYEYGKLIYKLLSNIDLEPYKLKVAQQEIIFDGILKKISPCFSDKNFKKVFFYGTNYYIDKLNLQIYLKDAKPKMIKTYSDFMKSDCDLIILIHNDSVRIYGKNTKTMQIIMGNLENEHIDYSIKKLNFNDEYLMYV